jgi:hypothetical protein
MSYQYDIFISYRRVGATRKWLENVFFPILNDIVALEIGQDPKIYIDSQIEVGSEWPNSLGEALSKSKVIIPLWSITYMESEWCKCEISHMLEREIKTGLKSQNNNSGLIFPTIIHDGETLPVQLSIIQKIEIQEYYVPFMDKNSSSAEELYRKLVPFGKSVAKSIKNAPQFQSQWSIESRNDFYKLFDKLNSPIQIKPPKFNRDE